METSTKIICPPDLSSRPFGLTAERIIALPVEKLFKAWTTQFDLWFAAPGSLLTKGEINSPFFFETYFEGVHHPHYGRFLRIEENKLVEFTWVTGEGGTEGAETVVNVQLTSLNEGTLVHLSHTGFPNETSRDRHQEAWPTILGQLEERMSRPID